MKAVSRFPYMANIILHLGISLAGYLIITTAATIAVFLKGKKKWFLKGHKAFSAVGVILAITGIFLSGFNFIILHAYIGLIASLGCVAALVLGQLAIVSEKDKKQKRVIHIWASRAWILTMTANIILGFIMILP